MHPNVNFIPLFFAAPVPGPTKAGPPWNPVDPNAWPDDPVKQEPADVAAARDTRSHGGRENQNYYDDRPSSSSSRSDRVQSDRHRPFPTVHSFSAAVSGSQLRDVSQTHINSSDRSSGSELAWGKYNAEKERVRSQHPIKRVCANFLVGCSLRSIF